jgi:hypothetical protein
MVAGVDVHEIQRHRRAHEVGYPEAKQVPIERKGRVDFGHHQDGMSYALRPSAEASCMPARTEWFVSDLTTMERLHTVTSGVAEGNHLSGATLVRHSGGFPPYCDAGLFQPRRQCIERRRVRNLPAEKTLSIRQPTVDNQALLSVVHPKGAHGAAAINRLKPKLAESKTGPVIEL